MLRYEPKPALISSQGTGATSGAEVPPDLVGYINESIECLAIKY